MFFQKLADAGTQFPDRIFKWRKILFHFWATQWNEEVVESSKSDIVFTGSQVEASTQSPWVQQRSAPQLFDSFVSDFFAQENQITQFEQQ